MIIIAFLLIIIGIAKFAILYTSTKVELNDLVSLSEMTPEILKALMAFEGLICIIGGIGLLL